MGTRTLGTCPRKIPIRLTAGPLCPKRILTYLNLNNHFEGSAPLSLRRFLDVLAGKRIDPPPF